MHVEMRSRVGRVSHSPTLEIHQKVTELREGGRDIVHLGFGESPFPAPSPIVAALRKHAGDMRYLPSQGSPILRERAAAYLAWRFGHATHPNRIIVGPGSKELIFDILLALKGDLILPSPSWVSYAPQGKRFGKKVIWAQCDPKEGYRLTADDLERACRKSKTTQKILVLNSPGNPTGAVLSKDELKDIAAVVRRHNVLVISDEIYAEITFGRKKYTSIASFCPERTLVTTGLSKGFSAGGYRLGILSVPKRMECAISDMVAIIGESFSCVAAPIQHAGVAAFSRDKNVRAYVSDTVAIHRMTGEYLHRQLLKLGLRCPRPEGAFYVFPDFTPYAKALRKRGITGDAALCAEMLEEQAVAVLPGSAFGVPAKHLAVRLSSCDYDGAAVLRAFRKRPPATQGEAKGFVERNCPHLPEAVERIRDYLRL